MDTTEEMHEDDVRRRNARALVRGAGGTFIALVIVLTLVAVFVAAGDADAPEAAAAPETSSAVELNPAVIGDIQVPADADQIRPRLEPALEIVDICGEPVTSGTVQGCIDRDSESLTFEGSDEAGDWYTYRATVNLVNPLGLMDCHSIDVCMTNYMLFNECQAFLRQFHDLPRMRIDNPDTTLVAFYSETGVRLDCVELIPGGGVPTIESAVQELNELMARRSAVG